METSPAEREVLTLKETCARLGISEDFGRKLLDRGEFPIAPLPRLGRRHRFSAWQINRYLAVGDEPGGDAA